MTRKWSKLLRTRYPGIRKTPDGTFVVQARQKDPGSGKTTEMTRALRPGTSIEEALEERAKTIRSLLAGAGGENEKPTLSDYAQLWLARKKRENLRVHTVERYLATLEQHILPSLGNLRIDEITRQHVQRWKDLVSRKVLVNGRHFAPWTMDGWFTVLRNILGAATLDYDLPRDPCDKVPGFKKPRSPRRERCLSAAQVKEFLRLVGVHCPQHYAITLVLMLYGLRWEEVSALHWSHLDIEAMEIRVVQSQVRRRVYTTKTDTQRILPLNQTVLDAINENREALQVRRNPGLEQGLLFPDSRGNYRLPSSVDKGWKTVSAAMGLAWTVTPHDLRRSYQNLLRQASVNQVVQQALMGHSSDAMTEHYSHVDMQKKRQAHENVVSLLEVRKTRT